MSKQEKPAESKAGSKNAVIAVIAVVAVVAVAVFLVQGQAGLFGLSDTKAQVIQPGEKGPVGQIKTFTDTGNDLELLDGKPVVRLFSTTWCPHCRWVKESFDKVMLEYQDEIVAYHWELDIGDDVLTPQVETSVPPSEQTLFQQFNPRGTIPTFVFGGKYVRVGTGYETQDDLASEEAEFRAVIEALLDEAGQ